MHFDDSDDIKVLYIYYFTGHGKLIDTYQIRGKRKQIHINLDYLFSTQDREIHQASLQRTVSVIPKDPGRTENCCWLIKTT